MPTLFKNIGWSSLTSLLQLYTGSVVFIVLAKMMSVNDFGILSFGYSLSAIIVVLADFGFSLMLIKDYPQEHNRSRYLFNSMAAKGVVVFFSLIIFGIYLATVYNGQWLKIGAIFVVFAIVASFIIYLQALLRIQNQFKGYANSSMVYALGVTGVVAVYWWQEVNLVEVAALLTLCKVLQLLWLLIVCKNSFSILSISRNRVFSLVKKSWSFGLFNILGILYFMVDTQIISIFLGAKEVALYQSVFRIVLILMLFSDVISNVILPFLSFKFHQKKNLSEFVERIFLYLLLIGCSIFLTFTTFKSEILGLLYTKEYLEAATLVLPFAIVLIFRTVSSVLGTILTISNQQRARVIGVGISLFISLGLNLTLVPTYGILAAAWSSVLVHAVLYGVYVVYSYKEIPSLRLGSPTVFSVLLVMFGLYGSISFLETGNYLITLICILAWSTFVFWVMKKDNNYGFLKKLLAEKGGV